MAPAVTYTIRIEVEAGSRLSLTGSSVVTTTILSKPLDSADTARQDLTACVTNVIPDYTMDNSVAVSPYGSYDGDNAYNSIGISQTDTVVTITPLSTVTYLVRIENDGNMNTPVTITASASSGGWTVTYHNGIDVTAPVITGSGITGTGWSRPGAITPAGLAYITVELRPSASVLGGNAGEYTDYVRVISNLNQTVTDTVRTRTRTNVFYQADSGISINAGGPFANMTITSTDGANQAVTQTVATNATVTYYIRLEHDGNGQNDTFSIVGTPGDTWWAVTYYNAASGGGDITSSITGTGWSWGPVGPIATTATDYTIIRVEVTPITNTSGATYTIYATIRSQGSGWNAFDMVSVNAICANYRPDLRYDTVSVGSYTDGNENYSDVNPPLGTPVQDYTVYTDTDVTITYYLRIENDGDNDTYSLSGFAGDGQWTISYYNDVSGGSDITNDVVNGVYTTTLLSGNWVDYRVEVIGISVPASTTRQTDVYAYSTSQFILYDAIRLNTIIRGYWVDNWIKRSADGSYIGDGEINTDGANQTITNTLTNNATVTYYITLQNDSNVTETISVTGSGAASGWSVSYYEGLTDGADITVDILNGAYSRTNMASGETYVIRIEVSAGGGLLGNDTITNTILSRCASNPSRQDLVRSVTAIIPIYTVDNRVALPVLYDNYEGDGIINTDGTSQTETITNITPLSTVTYLVRIENDGNMNTQVTLTASGSSGNWTVTYHDGLSATDPVITYSHITGAGWLRANSIVAGGFANICIELGAGSSVLGGATGEYTGYFRTLKSQLPTISDTIKNQTRTDIIYRADSGISDNAEGPFINMAITSTDGATQATARTLQTNATVTYYIRLENDGNVNDTFSVTGTGIVPSNWIVTYYDAPTLGNNITVSMTGLGWTWGPVNPVIITPADFIIIRAEVTPLTETSGATYTMIAAMRSQGAGYGTAAMDLVRATTTCFNFQPDLRYDTLAGGAYASGDGVYAPTPQSYTQYADSNATITYFIRVENDGSSDTFSLTASAPVADWTISYYDAVSGGADITSAMRNNAYTNTWAAAPFYRDYRVEVTGNSVISGSSSAAYFYSYSASNFDSYDAVQITTIARGYQADGLVKRGADVGYTGEDTYNLDGSSQTVTNTLQNSQMVSYHIRIQNDGNTVQSISVSASAGSAGWTITYYDSETGGADIKALVLSGAHSPTHLALGAAYTIRLEAEAGTSLSLAGGEVLTATILTRPLNTVSGTDVVRCVTEVIRDYTIDNLVAVSPTYTPYAGDEEYNETGNNQTDTVMTIPVNGTITYLVRIENDGNVATQVTLTGTPATSGWSVTYYNGLNTAAPVIPYSQITSVNGYLKSGSISAGGATNICLALTPASTTLGGAAGEYTGYVKIISVANASISDTIKTNTRTQVFYRADSGIRNPADGAYADMAITSTNGAGQSKAQSILNSGMVTYYIRVENDGNSDDVFSITGTPGNADWVISYYDAETGGADITTQVTGIGWAAKPMSPV